VHVRAVRATSRSVGVLNALAVKRKACSFQALMWEIGDLMAQWESLQKHAAGHAPES
jgi:hypothetical protein